MQTANIILMYFSFFFLFFAIIKLRPSPTPFFFFLFFLCEGPRTFFFQENQKCDGYACSQEPLYNTMTHEMNAEMK